MSGLFLKPVLRVIAVTVFDFSSASVALSSPTVPVSWSEYLSDAPAFLHVRALFAFRDVFPARFVVLTVGVPAITREAQIFLAAGVFDSAHRHRLNAWASLSQISIGLINRPVCRVLPSKRRLGRDRFVQSSLVLARLVSFMVHSCCDGKQEGRGRLLSDGSGPRSGP